MIGAGDIDAATKLAQHGRPLTPIETEVFNYKGMADFIPYLESEFNKIQPNSTTLRSLVLRNVFTNMNRRDIQKKIRTRERLCDIFLKALRDDDAQTVRDIANALDWCRQCRRSVDESRAKLLVLKKGLLKSGLKMTLREIGELILWHSMDNVDGMSQLRRLCKNLNVPIAPAKPGRSNQDK